MSRYNKDPQDVLDYGFDYSLWMSSGDTISTSVFSVGGTCAVTSSSVASHTAQCFVGSGTSDTLVKLSNKIVTSQGRTKEMSLDLRIINL
jgi:hypothetical protein